MKAPFFTLTTLTQKLCVYIGAATGAVLLLTIVLNYENRRKSVEAESNPVAMGHSQSAAQSADAHSGRVARLPRSSAARQEALQGEPNSPTMPFLSHLLDGIPPEEPSGVYEAFERKSYTDPLSIPWVDRKSFPNGVRVTYDYHQADWDKGAKESGSLFISEPYFDRGGAEIIIASTTQ